MRPAPPHPGQRQHGQSRWLQHPVPPARRFGGRSRRALPPAELPLLLLLKLHHCPRSSAAPASLPASPDLPCASAWNASEPGRCRREPASRDTAGVPFNPSRIHACHLCTLHTFPRLPATLTRYTHANADLRERQNRHTRCLHYPVLHLAAAPAYRHPAPSPRTSTAPGPCPAVLPITIAPPGPAQRVRPAFSFGALHAGAPRSGCLRNTPVLRTRLACCPTAHCGLVFKTELFCRSAGGLYPHRAAPSSQAAVVLIYELVLCLRVHLDFYCH